MVKELKSRFIKTTMLVVTIMLVVFLASINIINYSLIKRDKTKTLNNIIAVHLKSIPGVQAANRDPATLNGGINAVPAAENSSGVGTPGAEAPAIPNGSMEGMTEPEPPASPAEVMTEPEPPSGSIEPMSEGGPGAEELDGRGANLGRFAVARMNSQGAIVFKNMVHDPDMTLSDLVDLINAANVEFAPKATGETETEAVLAEGTSPEGNQPAGEGSTPPGNEGAAPGGAEGAAPAGEGSTPPGNEGAASAEGQVPAGEAGAPPENEGTIAPREASGTVKGYMYYAVQQADGSILYAFLNISEQTESVIRIAVLTCVLGVAIWFLILLVVVFLSTKAIAPIAENIEKQRQFITDAGHEIKTPLAVIVSNVDVQELHSGKTKWLNNIRSQALRLSELTKQMLTLSKMEETGSAVFVSTTFDASKELEEMVRLFRESASLRGIEIKTDIEPEVQIHFPKEQYQQLAELLLDNAMKYGKEHGFLSVSLHSERKTVTLSFKNDCDQLPDIDPDRLFERFYRSDSSRSRQTGGSGIGLAVVRAIAEHGGGYAKAHFLPNEVIEFEIQLQKKVS